MKNKQAYFGILFVIGISLIFGSSFVNAEVGSNWETTCDNGECQTTLYSYEKYWFNETVSEWEEVDENFYDCSRGGRTRYCSNDYHFQAVIDDFGNASVTRGGSRFAMRMNNFRGQSPSFNPVVNGSIVTYEDVIPGYVDVRYQFLPRKFKEEVVIKQRIPSLPNNDFNLTFNIESSSLFKVEPAYICDSNHSCMFIPYWVENDLVKVQVPALFLNDPDTVYPVVIDPTVALNDSSIAWNGYVVNTNSEGGTIFERTNNPSSIITIGDQITFGGSEAYSRGSIEWNISSIPDYSTISDLKLQLYMDADTIDPVNITLNVSHMDGNSNTYDNNTGNCNGNCNFYLDMANGTIYNSSIHLTRNIVNISLPEAISNFEDSLSADLFNIGLDGYNGAGNDIKISSRDYFNQSLRPKITVTYGVNNSDGNDAIVQGINASLPGNPVASGQQIYLVDENGTHYLGRFDKATVFGNQTWGFNYVDIGESFTNMPSLLRALNIWEDQTLSFQEIVDQVSAFINSTIY